MSNKDVMGRALQRVSASATARNLNETLDQNATTTPIFATAPGTDSTEDRLHCLATGNGLSITPVCTSTPKITQVICTLISEKLGFEDEAQVALGKELDTYFSELGISSDDIFGFLSTTSWDSPIPEKGSKSMLALSVIHAIMNLSQFTKTVRINRLFLTESITYDELEKFKHSLRPSRQI